VTGPTPAAWPATASGAGRRTRARRALERALGMDALLALAVVGGFAYASLRAINDPDLPWHLKAGAGILATHRLPWSDPWSYVGTQPWFAYSWLAEVLFAAVYDTAGAVGLIVLATTVIAATLAVTLHACRATGARPWVAIGATFAAAAASSVCWSVRPHLFSFLCMAIFVDVVTLDRRRGVDRLWLLVPTMVVWANTHVLFPFGLALLGLHAVTRGRAWWSRRRLLELAAVGAAPLATPYGVHLLRYLWTLADEPVAFSMVAEFQTPSLHTTTGIVLTALFLATTLALVLSPARKDPADVGGVFLFALLAYWMGRNIPYFAVVAAPVLALHADALLPRRARAAHPLTGVQLGINAAVIALGLVLLAGRARALAAPGAAIDRRAFPVAAVSFLEAEPDLGRLFSHFDWGGYLIGRLHPRYQVSIDGRTNVYGNEVLRAYRATMNLEPDWRAFLDRCRPDVVLWPRRGALARALALLPEWRRVWADDLAVIFVRRDHPLRAALERAAATPRTPSARDGALL
jgi:hypothetical protein